jgi:hypothetical protein
VEELLNQIKGVAQKGTEAKDSNLNWILRGFAALAFFATLAWAQYKLSKKAKELAKVRIELEQMKVKAEVEVTRAKVDALGATAQKLYDEDAKEAAAALAQHEAEEAKFAEVQAKLEKVKKWEDLNVIAGVKP